MLWFLLLCVVVIMVSDGDGVDGVDDVADDVDDVGDIGSGDDARRATAAT